MGKKNKKMIKFEDGQSWSERELAQIIRRKMISKGEKNKKKYSRKEKHKTSQRENGWFFFFIIDKKKTPNHPDSRLSNLTY